MATHYAKLQMFLGTREDEVKSGSLNTDIDTIAMFRLLSQSSKWSKKWALKEEEEKIVKKLFVRFLGFSEWIRYYVAGTADR